MSQAVDPSPYTPAVTPVIDASLWSAVSRRLLSKALREYCYEELLTAEQIGPSGPNHWRYELRLAAGVTYRFTARPTDLGHLWVDEGSIERTAGATTAAASDVLQFTVDAASTIGITPFTLSYLLREISQTLIAEAHLRQRAASVPAAALLTLPEPEVEALLDGHPWLVMSKGRHGFDYNDLQLYGPETARPVRLLWLAVRRSRLSAGPSAAAAEAFVAGVIGDEQLGQFAARLQAAGQVPQDFAFLPLHPWQWREIVLTQLISDVAQGHLLLVGETQDEYLPLQSIRTFANVTHPERPHIKLALSIFNTSIYRGLPPRRATLAPTLSAWLQAKVAGDAFLGGGQRLTLLSEVAGMAYHHPYSSQVQEAPYQFYEHLGVIWRESPHQGLAADERVLPLAAFWHVDAAGTSLVEELVRQAGMTPAAWLSAFFAVTLQPLVHVLAKYGVSFNPHGQNTAVVLRGGVPVRLVMKDFIDDVNISDQDLPELRDFPDVLAPLIERLPAAILRHFILSSLGMCGLRYLAPVAEARLGIAEGTYWGLLRRAFDDYLTLVPEMRGRVEAYEFTAAKIPKVCVNRVRLLTQGYGDAAGRPVAAVHGEVRNPLAY